MRTRRVAPDLPAGDRHRNCVPCLQIRVPLDLGREKKASAFAHARGDM
jgi:hypothetical protein